MRIPLTNVLLQTVLFILLFLLTQWLVKLARVYTDRIGWNERLFPRKLVGNDKLTNEHRAKIAEQILVDYQKSSNKQNSNEKHNIEIRVVASDRGGTYLLQTVALLMEQQNIGKYNLSICNVEKTIFEDLKKFENLVPILNLENRLEKTFQENSTLYKENLDYWKCLGVPSESKYIILIEDDSLIISEFSSLLQSMIQLLDESSHVDFVKLYHPLSLRKIPSIFLTITFSLLFSFAFCFIVFKLFGSFPILTFILLTFSLSYNITGYGSHFPAEVRYKLTGSAYISFPESCCTEAVIFRKSRIEEMLVYFNKSVGYKGHAKDHILDDSPFVGRQSDLNYINHIGSFSSVRHRTVVLSDFSEIQKFNKE